jgi:transposase-like protein
MKTRDRFFGVNSICFYERFPDDNSCYQYIAEIKWKSGFVCKKCGHDNYCAGRKPSSRRCTRCKYDESATAGTMFDKCKFSIHIAFHIAFKISTKKKEMSSFELSREFDLRQKTCWEFKWKIHQAMRSSKKYPLSGTVHVDEFYVGEYEEGKSGRSHDSKKRLVVVALEILKQGGVGRAYARVIDQASGKEFKPFFEDHISIDTQVVTDEWKGYLPLKKKYQHLKQIPSKKGANFPKLHIHIMNVQGWLRGIHHHCSKEHLQGYLDEFHYRYNRRNHTNTIFDNLISRMVRYEPIRRVSEN